MEENDIQQSALQQNNLHEVIKLENQLKGGANWFFWIAGLSLVNSLALIFGGSLNFIVGLGITQIIDAIAAGITAEVPPNIGTIVKVIGFILVVGIAGIFALFAVLGKKRYKWALILGMVLYAFDGLIFLFIGDMLSAGFHAFALFGIWGGLRALKRLETIDDSGYTMTSSQPFPKQKQVWDRKFWRRLMWPALILLIPFFIFLIMFFLSY